MKLHIRLARALRALANRLDPLPGPTAPNVWTINTSGFATAGTSTPYWINGRRYIDGRPA